MCQDLTSDLTTHTHTWMPHAHVWTASQLGDVLLLLQVLLLTLDLAGVARLVLLACCKDAADDVAAGHVAAAVEVLEDAQLAGHGVALLQCGEGEGRRGGRGQES